MNLNDVIIDDRAWAKSTRCPNGADCVEVAQVPGQVIGMRDSKQLGAGELRFSPAAWQGFLDEVKAGGFDPR